MRLARGAAIASAVAALAACGGGATPAAPTTTAIDELARFRLAANAVCADTQTQLTELETAIQGATTREEVAVLLADRFIPAIRAQVATLRSLDAPVEVAAELEAILAEIEVRLAPIEADPATLVEPGADLFGDLNQRLLDLGLATCAGR